MLRTHHKSLALALIVVGLVSMAASNASAHGKPRLDIRVTDAETENPVGIPRVKLFHILTDELEHNISCNAQGMASVNIKPGLYRVTIERYGYQKKEIKLLMGLGSKTLRVQLNSNSVASPTPAPAPIPAPIPTPVPTPAPLPTAKGTLFIAAKVSVPPFGAQVGMAGIQAKAKRIDVQDNAHYSSGSTSQGNIVMILPPGRYLVTVSFNGFQPQQFVAQIASSSTSSKIITLKK